MNELRSSLDALGLKPGATEVEVKKAYREMAMVWHPDRFPADSPLQEKAQAKLRELNAAYQFLLEHGFADGASDIAERPIEESPESTETSPAAPEETTSDTPSQTGKGILIVLAFLLAGGAAWWVFSHKAKAPVSETAQTLANNPTNLSANVVTNQVAAIPAKPAANDISTNDLLSSMRVSGESTVITNQDGIVLMGEGWLHTRDEYSPPLIIRTVCKTDVTNIRIRYGEGVVIFNWEGNPSELRFHDPVTGKLSTAPGQGLVPANELQTIEWHIETNYSSISVNGAERARFPGNYSGVSELPGIRTAAGAKITVQQFEVRKLSSQTSAQRLSPNAGLVLYFPFNADEKGSVSDQSGFRNHGGVHGASYTADGKVGGAMSFHGSSGGGDFIMVPNSPSLTSMQPTRQITVCAWIKVRSLPSEYPVILAKGGNFAPKANGGYEMNLRFNDGPDLTFDSGKYGVVGWLGKDSWVPKHMNEWIHVAAVVNATAGKGKLYINGERAPDDNVTELDPRKANFNLANDLFIGGPDPSHHPNRAWFDGLIDEVRVYARALTAEEIRSLPGFDKSNP